MCDTVKGQNSVSVIQEAQKPSDCHTYKEATREVREREIGVTAEIRAMKKDKQARHVMSDMITQKSRTIVLVYKLKKQNQKMFHLNPRN